MEQNASILNMEAPVLKPDACRDYMSDGHTTIGNWVNVVGDTIYTNPILFIFMIIVFMVVILLVKKIQAQQENINNLARQVRAYEGERIKEKTDNSTSAETRS